MKRNLFAYLLPLTFVCCKPQPHTNTQVKVINALQNAENIEVTITSHDEQAVFHPKFGIDQAFRALPSGKADIYVRANGRLILNKVFGLGNDGKYTFLLEGIPRLSKKTNQQTFSATVHTTFAGAEASDINGCLPRITLIRNVTMVKSGQSKIRLVNAFAVAEPLTLTLTGKDHNKINFKQPYPTIGKFKAVSAGEYRVELDMAKKQYMLIDNKRHLKPGCFYTAVLMGNLVGSKGIKVLLLENKSENNEN